MVSNRAITAKRAVRKRSALQRIGRIFLSLFWILPFVVLAAGIFFFSFVIFPPFGSETTAKVLLVGLDDKPRQGGPQRSDTIILFAGRLDGSGATLLSVPRDSRVPIPGYVSARKINAAYALGGLPLLRKTLSQEETLGADLPYHVVFDSTTVSSIVDALGGIEVVVPYNMNYDDNWGNLHIHLKKGRQLLNGGQAVGYLRWRKNTHGRSSDDFSRTERQRQVLVAMKDKLRSWNGMKRLPAVYRALRAHSTTNLSLTQLLQLAWISRNVQTDAVPGTPRMLHGVSYVQCDWMYGQQRWQQAIR